MAKSVGDRTPLITVVFLASLVAIVVVNVDWLSPDTWLWGAYPLTAALMVAAILAIGTVLNGRPAGLIIDDRNRMSLSKFQMLLWTVVVVSALTVSAAYNLRHGFPVGADPLQIAIPDELLFAMGIAATSFVATPTILSLKSQETPSSADIASAGGPAGPGSASTLQNSGKVHGRTEPSLAKWGDMFRGDEVGNYNTPDLSKIQQFAITLLLVGIYSSEVIALLIRINQHDPKGIGGLPGLGSQFVVLMGISHASYLAYKAAPHTVTGDASAATTNGAVNPPGTSTSSSSTAGVSSSLSG